MTAASGAADDEPLRLKSGVQIDGYVLDRRVGFGGMAEVWLAHRRHAPFAIKVLHTDLGHDPEFKDMFRDEIDLARSLDHPNVVRVIEAKEVGGALLQVMEWIDGSDLHSLEVRLERDGGRFPVAVAVEIIRDTACGLNAAHQLLGADGRPRQLVHRDVAPQNIMVGRDGRVKVVDFGVAKARNRLTRTAAGVVKGRLGYMAPEQARGLDVTPRADVFALGVVAWEVVAMDRMFPLGGGVLDVAERPPPPRLDALQPDVPAAFAELVARMLAASPEDRPSMQEVIEGLDALRDRRLDLSCWCRNVLPGRRTTAVAPRPSPISDRSAPTQLAPSPEERSAEDLTETDDEASFTPVFDEWEAVEPTLYDRGPYGDEAAPTDENEVVTPSRGPTSDRTVVNVPLPDDETWAAPLEHAQRVRGPLPDGPLDRIEPGPTTDPQDESGGWIHRPVGLGPAWRRQSFERTRELAMTRELVVPQELTRSESGGVPMFVSEAPWNETAPTRVTAPPEGWPPPTGPRNRSGDIWEESPGWRGRGERARPAVEVRRRAHSTPDAALGRDRARPSGSTPGRSRTSPRSNPHPAPAASARWRRRMLLPLATVVALEAAALWWFFGLR